MSSEEKTNEEKENINKYNLPIDDTERLLECSNYIDDALYAFLVQLRWVGDKFPEANIKIDMQELEIMDKLQKEDQQANAALLVDDD